MEWFKHDSDAHDDIKIKKLLKRHGFSALGIYWFLVELLFLNDGRLEYSEAIDQVTLIDGLSENNAKDYIDQLVELNLMYTDGSSLRSHRVDSEIKYNENWIQKKVEAGRLGGLAKASKCQANVKQTLADASECQADGKQNLAKSSTLHNITLPINTPLVSKDTIPPKGRTLFKKPTLDEVRAYCFERNNGIDAESFIAFYESNGWKVGKNPMKDWKAAIRTWESRRRESDNAKKKNEICNDRELLKSQSDENGRFQI